MDRIESRSAAAAQWFGQPRGLTVLFLTEMWEKFSFYGMRSLLVLYMTKHLAIAQQDASWIYGTYAALVYLTPVFGGLIADRWLGRRLAVIFGGLIMAGGHFMMASRAFFIWRSRRSPWAVGCIFRACPVRLTASTRTTIRGENPPITSITSV
jgi:dipeptide/tripeptide permease